MVPDPYVILGVTPDASQEELKTAYRQRVKEFHPDRHPDIDKDAAHELMAQINAAWAILGNENKRALYDRTRQRTSRPNPTTKPSSSTKTSTQTAQTRKQPDNHRAQRHANSAQERRSDNKPRPSKRPHTERQASSRGENRHPEGIVSLAVSYFCIPVLVLLAYIWIVGNGAVAVMLIFLCTVVLYFLTEDWPGILHTLSICAGFVIGLAVGGYVFYAVGLRVPERLSTWFVRGGRFGDTGVAEQRSK